MALSVINGPVQNRKLKGLLPTHGTVHYTISGFPIEKYNGVRLTAKTTWKAAVGHKEHVNAIRTFLTTEDPTYGYPCKDGINIDYINNTLSTVPDETGSAPADDIVCAMTVTAGGGTKDEPERVVLTLVCKDLNASYPSAQGIANRLFLSMICGRYPKATAVAFRTLKDEARRHGYKGISLTASQVPLIETYRRYGFEVTSNADKSANSVPYRDRVKQFMPIAGYEDLYEEWGRKLQGVPRLRDGLEKYRPLFDKTWKKWWMKAYSTKKWREEVIVYAGEDPYPGFQTPATVDKKEAYERFTKAYMPASFWKAQREKILGKKNYEIGAFPEGDGIFMDLILPCHNHK